MYVTVEQFIGYFVIGFILGMIPTMLLRETADTLERAFILSIITVCWGIFLVIAVCLGIPIAIIKGSDWLVSRVRG